MKQMKQPRKDVLREQLALAAEEIIRLRSLLTPAPAPVRVSWSEMMRQWLKPEPRR